MFIKKIVKNLVVGSILIVPIFINAEENNITNSDKKQVKQEVTKVTDNKKQVKQETNKETLEAALKLVNEMGIKKSYSEAIDILTNNLIQKFPELKKVKDKIRDFYEKYVGWDVVKDDIAKIYAKHFSKKELEDLLNFYKSPTGKKAIKKMPMIMLESRNLGMKKVASHMDELKEIIKNIK